MKGKFSLYLDFCVISFVLQVVCCLKAVILLHLNIYFKSCNLLLEQSALK